MSFTLRMNIELWMQKVKLWVFTFSEVNLSFRVLIVSCICEIDVSLFSAALSDLPHLPVSRPHLTKNTVRETQHLQYPISNALGPFRGYCPIFSSLNFSASSFNNFALEIAVKPGS